MRCILFATFSLSLWMNHNSTALLHSDLAYNVTLFDWVFLSGCVFLWPYIFAPPACPNILDFSNFMYLLHKDSIGGGRYWKSMSCELNCIPNGYFLLFLGFCNIPTFQRLQHWCFWHQNMHLFNMVHMCHVDSIVSDSGKFAHSEFYRVLRLFVAQSASLIGLLMKK